MANMCVNNVYVYGDEKHLKKLYNIMCDMQYKASSDLDEVFYALGADRNRSYCRAWLDDVSYSDNVELRFSCESAWSEPSELFEFLCEKMPGIEIQFTAEEVGSSYFVTTDPNGLKYCTVIDGVWEYHYSLEELLECVNDIYGEEFTTLEEVVEFGKHTKEFELYEYELVESYPRI